MLKTLFRLFTISFILLVFTTSASIPLTFNIISHSLENGAGKEIDVSILKENLELFGHKVNLFDYYVVNSVTHADINLFLAQFKPEWFSKAKLNWFIPNAEFCYASLKDLQKFDLVLCKTEESFRIFNPLCKQCFYLGFTSIDRYQPFVGKNFAKYLHVAGKSRMKGTEEILNTWKHYKKLPNLVLIKHSESERNRSNIEQLRKITQKNLKLITKRVSNQSLLILQNECGIHLCPSKTEGFGHYIMEAMSTGAVIATTDAPPMNEFIHDERCLIKYKHTGKVKYATTYSINEPELAATIYGLQKLSKKELKMIGDNNRQEYLRRTAEFKENFRNLMKKAELEITLLPRS